MSAPGPVAASSKALAPDQAAWLADGVRHQLMLRVLPVQRHDMLGPLSVLRMALAILKRRLGPSAAPGAGWPDRAAAAPTVAAQAAGLLSKVEEAGTQVAATVAAVAALRCWDGQQAPARQPLGHVLADCSALLQLAMGLRGQHLALLLPDAAVHAPDQATDQATALVEVPAAHHAVLALLVHATEAHSAAARWQWRLADDGLWLSTEAVLPLQPDAPADGPVAAGRTLRPIDRTALDALLRDIGWRLTQDRGGWCLGWPAASA